MTLGELIKALESVEDKTRIVKKGFAYPHSWRGVYAELAFEPAENVSIQSMLDCAKEALGKTYEGWKGGDFKMDEYTDIHISECGTSYDFVWDYLLEFWRTGMGSKKKKFNDDWCNWYKDIEIGRWVHIVITNEGVYKDGKLIATKEASDGKGR